MHARVTERVWCVCVYVCARARMRLCVCACAGKLTCVSSDPWRARTIGSSSPGGGRGSARRWARAAAAAGTSSGAPRTFGPCARLDSTVARARGSVSVHGGTQRRRRRRRAQGLAVWTAQVHRALACAAAAAHISEAQHTSMAVVDDVCVRGVCAHARTCKVRHPRPIGSAQRRRRQAIEHLRA